VAERFPRQRVGAAHPDQADDEHRVSWPLHGPPRRTLRGLVTEIKAFVPARDFALSKRFYQDLGFTLTSEGGGVAYLHCGHAALRSGRPAMSFEAQASLS
jgi:hypothetical protein